MRFDFGPDIVDLTQFIHIPTFFPTPLLRRMLLVQSKVSCDPSRCSYKQPPNICGNPDDGSILIVDVLLLQNRSCLPYMLHDTKRQTSMYIYSPLFASSYLFARSSLAFRLLGPHLARIASSFSFISCFLCESSPPH